MEGAAKSSRAEVNKPIDRTELEGWTKAQLKEWLNSNGGTKSGNKAALVNKAWKIIQNNPQHLRQDMAEAPEDVGAAASTSRDKTDENAVAEKEKPKEDMPWIGHSKRWKEKLIRLQLMRKESPDNLAGGLGEVVLCVSEEFTIGQGSFGTQVYVGMIEDGRAVAVKEVQQTGKQWKKSMKDEVDILAQLCQHENIVSYVWAIMPPEQRFGYIILELCDYNLKEWLGLDSVTGQSKEQWKQTAAGLIKNLLSGLNCLHINIPKIIHRDLKPENIFIVFRRESDTPILKLADFGISRAVAAERNTCVTGIAGTRYWQASEVLASGTDEVIRYTVATDVQVTGMLGFYILTKGKHPFCAHLAYMMESKILKGEPDLSAVTDPVAVDMLKKMLPANPKERSSAASLLE